MRLTSEWIGRGDDPAGTGVFEEGTEVLEVEFQRFSDYYAIHQLILRTYEAGRQDMAENIERRVILTIKEAR